MTSDEFARSSGFEQLQHRLCAVFGSKLKILSQKIFIFSTSLLEPDNLQIHVFGKNGAVGNAWLGFYLSLW